MLTILCETLERNVSRYRSNPKPSKVTEEDLDQECSSGDSLLFDDPKSRHRCLSLTDAYISDKVGRLSNALASILSRESL